MDTTKELKINTQAEIPQEVEPNFNILKFTLKTLFFVVIIGVLLFSCFFSFFPYQGMKFFTDLDLKKRALDCATTYVVRNESDYGNAIVPSSDSKFADALLSGFNNSVYLMNEDIAKGGYSDLSAQYFAQKLVQHSKIYLTYNVSTGLNDRTAAIDAYNKKHSLPQVHPTLYSFADYIRTSQVRARLVLGEAETLRQELLTTTSTWDATVWNIPTDSKTYHESFLVFAFINEYMKMELNKLNFDSVAKDNQGNAQYDDIFGKIVISDKRAFSYFITKDGEFTPLYDRVYKRFTDFIDEIKLHANASTSAEMLEYSYYLKMLVDFSLNMRYMSHIMNANKSIYSMTFQDKLNKMYETWSIKSQVKNVPMHTGGGIINNDWSDIITVWYFEGMRYFYIKLYNDGF